MADAGFAVGDDGRWLLSGELSFESVPALLITHQVANPDTGGAIRVDLAEVTRVDSAGLALLVEWLRVSRAAGVSIVFENVPAQLQAIAQVCGLDNILPLSA